MIFRRAGPLAAITQFCDVSLYAQIHHLVSNCLVLGYDAHIVTSPQENRLHYIMLPCERHIADCFHLPEEENNKFFEWRESFFFFSWRIHRHIYIVCGVPFVALSEKVVPNNGQRTALSVFLCFDFPPIGLKV